MKLGCDDVRDLAPDVLRGATSATVALAVREHAASCAECAAEIELIRTISRQHAPAPAGLHERVVAQIQQRARPRSHQRRVPLAIAATIALLLIGSRAFLPPPADEESAAVAPPVEGPAADEPVGPGWMTVESAWNSGAASLADLTEEQLKALLRELES